MDNFSNTVLRTVVFFVILNGFHYSYSQQREELKLDFRKLDIEESSKYETFLGPVSGGFIFFDSISRKIRFYSNTGEYLKSKLISSLTNKSEVRFFYSNSQVVLLDSEGNGFALSDIESEFKEFGSPSISYSRKVVDVYCEAGYYYFLTLDQKNYLELYKVNDNGIVESYESLQVKGEGPASLVLQNNGISKVPYLSFEKELKYFDQVQDQWVSVLTFEEGAYVAGLSEFGAMHILVSLKNGEHFDYYLLNTITNSFYPLDIDTEIDNLFITGNRNEVLFTNTEKGLFVGDQVLGQYQFSVIDIILFTGYFVLLILMGYSFSRNATSTQEYFKVKRKIPWWAAGVSILATKLSAVTFLSLPVKAFATDWMYFWLPAGNILLAIFVVRYILPFYSNLDVTTSFEYLEKRFNVSIRKLGAYTYIISEITKSGVVILIPSLVISVVSGIDLFLCISLIGIVVTIYTVLGGIEAVIWIDVIQVVVMIGGVLAAILIIGINLDVLNLKLLFKPVLHTYKINLFDLDMDLSRATLIVIVLSWFGKIQDYVSNQAVVQKLITTKDIESTKRSTWMACLLNIPVNLLFLVMGSALFLFYQDKPERIDPLLPMPDALFVDFITAEMPHGLVALVIAGVFAAAMSTLAGSMNSMSTTVVINLLGDKNIDDRRLLKLARVLTIGFGILATLSAVVVALFEIKSLYDLVFLVIGLFGGGLAGLFILGMFTVRGNSLGALIGFISSAAILFYVTQYTQLNLFLYGPIGIFSCIIIGYLVSLAIPDKGLSDFNLTIHKRK